MPDVLRVLNTWLDYHTHHPTTAKLLVASTQIRVSAVGAVALGEDWSFLPVSPASAALSQRQIAYIFLSGFNPVGTTAALQFEDTIILQQKAVPLHHLWDFAYSKDFKVNASDIQISSPFLKQQQKELSELAKRSDQERYLELSQLVTDLHKLLQQPHSFSVSLQAQSLCTGLEAMRKRVLEEARKGGVTHFTDAEMHWLYTLLHDDSFLDSVRLRYKHQPGTLTFHLLVTKAPCDHCSRMIVAKHADLKTRFERDIELVIYAKSAYEGTGPATCVGLEQIGKNCSWLTYKRLWQDM